MSKQVTLHAEEFPAALRHDHQAELALWRAPREGLDVPTKTSCWNTPMTTCWPRPPR
jgi:hypothetical protein